MARRPRNSEEDVSLFPFLSILACVIGVLTLLISALALASMDTESMAMAEELEQLQHRAEEDRREVEALQAQLRQRQSQQDQKQGQQQQELADAKARLEDIRRQIEQARKPVEPDETLPDEIASQMEVQRQKIEELKEELQRQRERIAQLEKEIAQRELSDEAEVTILPSGSGANFEPFFVECAADAVILHTGDRPETIPRGDLAGHESFGALLSQVEKARRGTIVFLIRDDGLATYHRARALVEENGIHHGRLPVIGQGRLDLSHFKGDKS